MKEENTFNYEVVEHIATLSENGSTTKELNKVSYNGSAAKYDLRQWRHIDGEVRLLKGLTLTDEEAKALKDALNSIEDL
ncbi:MAG: transcriptional coactivator p15/PC4 family protein [Clostridia bacterium]|nr:transcriptional coactivator p15/PC4 family protein [Clostridia bacterium]MCD8308671.1 transcriptional coactivator p15/PC4 family protein [Clostridia bacterium]